MKNITFIFPPCGGGAWLSNLIYNLENNKTQVSTTDVVTFDHLPKCRFDFKHEFLVDLENNLTYQNHSNTKIVFSNAFAFNHYINIMFKHKFNTHFDNNSFSSMLASQLDVSTNAAVYYCADTQYSDAYYKNIDLDHRLLFQDPEEFTNTLFDTLDKISNNYTRDRKFVLDSIAYYRSTCVDPALHYDNFDSIIWLGWCHAVCTINQVSCDTDLFAVTDIDQIKQVFLPHRDIILAYSQDRVFFWN